MQKQSPGAKHEKQLNASLQRFKAEIFQALAHPTRVAIVDILRLGPVSAGEILSQLKKEQPNISQHLSVLRSHKIVVSRKAGTQVIYSLRDPVLIQVLNLLREYFFAHLSEAQDLLGALGEEPRPRKSPVRSKAGTKTRKSGGR